MHRATLASIPVALNVCKSGTRHEAMASIVSGCVVLTANVPFCTASAATAMGTQALRLDGVNRKNGSEQAAVQFATPGVVSQSPE